MRKPELLEIRDVALADIHIEARLRPVNPQALQSLMSSIETIGLKDNIHLRRVRSKSGLSDGTTYVLKLLAGGHRVDAFHQLGFDVIPAKIWDCTDDYARLIEIDDNLARSDLEPLDLAMFLAERKRVYEDMYPQTKQASGAELAAKRWDASANLAVASFVRSTSEHLGKSERNLYRALSAAQSLDAHSVELLRASPNRVTMADLQVIAKATPDERPIICRDMSLGKVKSAKEVLDRRKHPGAKAGTPADLELRKMDDAWARSSKAAKRRFAEAHAAELRELLNVEQYKDAASGLSFATRRAE